MNFFFIGRRINFVKEDYGKTWKKIQLLESQTSSRVLEKEINTRFASYTTSVKRLTFFLWQGETH